ncbi:hypothetical protein EVAR_73294_1 [Eumeta japonica]|uniref:Uncharacterized protein n=1 Tax=Eumeta variegata TaxID=151549 RepID=A0A4C1TPA1_EUMVA|nr:hypothetical protein EVAR_73294_1 [Eumeta japonica]
MHWACKRGDENLVKLFAGIDRGIVNVRSPHNRFGPLSRSRFRSLPVSNIDSAPRLAYDLDSDAGHGSDFDEARSNASIK